MNNALYYGDNLPILREHLPDESVDLVYLDPPFNSNATYNVLFQEKGGEHYGILAYMLGICYVKLDIGGDNIAQANKWMGISAKEAHPYQGEARKTLSAIRKAME